MKQGDTDYIKLQDVTKVFEEGETTVALDKINLNIRSSEFLTLLGPSGCGKTTTLRLIAGFEMPTSGTISIAREDVTHVPPYKRQVNTVFQKYALFPHLNVYDNIAFGLTIKKMDSKLIAKKVGAMLELVGLPGYEKRKVNAMSGGQQQRIAIARALVNEPEVLLLDEPLGALDLKLRKGMQRELKAIQQELGITFVYVTHDQEEALTMSDTIVVMRQGRIQQIGTPTDIYNEPKNAFVADFIGESNIMPAIMEKDYVVRLFSQSFACLDAGFAPDEEVQVVVRPEDVDVVPYEQGALKGMVESIIFMGVHYEMIIKTEGFSWTVHSTDPQVVGSRVGLSLEPDSIHVMKAEREETEDEAQ